MKKYYIVIIILFFANIALKAQQISLFAGTPNSSGYTNGNTLSNTKFNLPWGLAIDTLGNIWVSEIGGHTIRMITPSGYIYARAGQYGNNGFFNASGITSKFDNPKGIAIGPDNSIYVADAGNHVIRKISPFTSVANAQTITVFAGKYSTGSTNYVSYPGYANGNASVAQFYFPSGIACDDTGNVYVADNYNHCIRKITPSGVVSTIAGQANSSGKTDGNAKTKAKFSNPSDLFLQGSVLYISDNANSRLRKLDLSSNMVSTVDSSLWTPNSITVWKNNIYIADQHRVMKKTSNSLITYCGSVLLNQSGYTNGYGNSTRFYNIKGLFFNKKDSFLYAADMDNHVIRKISVCQDANVNITISRDTTFCDGDSVVLTGPAGFSKYLWSNGDTNRTAIVKNTVNIKLTVRSSDSCASISRIIQITRKKRPTSTFFIDSTFCVNGNDTVIYTGNGITTATYTWNFDTANVISGSKQGPYIINWNKTGTKNVSLKVTENGCESLTTTKKITVYPIPIATFKLKNIGCAKTNDTITYTGNAGSAAIYTWNFDGAQIISGSGKGPYILRWNTSGTKTVSLTVTDHNCISTKTSQNVSINTTPIASMSYSAITCEGKDDTITFTGTAGTSATYLWKFDNGNITSGSGKGPYLVRWTSIGTKNISVEVSDNGCISAPATASINVKKTPSSSFKLKKSTCTDHYDTITYTGNAGALASYNWDFGGAGIVSGSVKGPFVVYWSSPGTKNVTLQVEENGCLSDIKIETIIVNEAPVAMFSMKTNACADEVVNVSFTGTASTNAVFIWNFGGGDIISGSDKGPYQIKWTTEGSKKVTLEIQETSCNAVPFSLNITIKKKPTSTFNAPSEVCEGKQATITYTGNGISSANFSWNFDGATIQSGSGIGPYQLLWNSSGMKNTTLDVNEAGCTSTQTVKQINVLPKPTVPVIKRKGDTLTSSADSNNQWYNQSGKINGAVNKKFAPPSDGIYYVIVTGNNGCTSQSDNFNFIRAGIQSLNVQKITIYPNPAKNQITIELPENVIEHYILSIADASGKILLTNIELISSININISELKQGIYILKLQSNSGIQYFYFIKAE